jgi:uncharacterized heparinase superfamily protein
VGSDDNGSGTTTDRLKRAVANSLFGTRVYDLTLGKGAPSALVGHVRDAWPGTVEKANILFQGRYEFAGESASALNEPPWAMPGSDYWRAELHGFSWLRHFSAAGGEAARLGGRELIRTWIEGNENWDELTWRGDVMGQRLTAWAAHAGFLLEGADPTFRKKFLAAFARQSKHLGRAIKASPEGRARIATILGLVTSDIALTGGGPGLERALQQLRRELSQQILADGSHVSRSPSQHFAVLADLISIRESLASGGHAPTGELTAAIRRLAASARFFLHGDGNLALFNSSNETPTNAQGLDISTILAAARTGNKTKDELPVSLPQGGYERLTADNTLVLVDVGGPPTALYCAQAHAAPLAFEMSIGRERLIVNCGSHRSPQWRMAGRSTAAHSSLTLADTNAIELEEPGGVGKRRCTVTASRMEDDGSTWLEAAHDGYAPFGVVCGRRYYLAKNGGLKGEDTLSWQGTKKPAGHPFAVRFHLHPDVQASLVRDGEAVLLRLGKGMGLTFHAGGAALSLEESVYMGQGEIRRSEQIVLSGILSTDGAVIKWAFVPVDG